MDAVNVVRMQFERLFLERLAYRPAVLASVDHAAVSLCSGRCSEKTGGHLIVLAKDGPIDSCKKQEIFLGNAERFHPAISFRLIEECVVNFTSKYATYNRGQPEKP